MINRDITFEAEAHKKIKAGVDKLANVVKTTLGPGGTNVILQRQHTQVITKDGVSVAREIWLDDPIENMAAQIVKSVAEKTVQEAGDGTTTATVLTQAIYSGGLKHHATGAKPIDLKRGIDIATAEVVKELKKLAKPVGKEDIHKIATISANGDKEIGKLVGDAITEIGLEGLVTVEDSKSYVTELKKVEGMRWDRGYMSHHFITNQEKQECLLEEPVVLIYDGTIGTMREMMGHGKNNIIEKYRQDPELGSKPLLIIAHDFGQEALSTMAVNAQRGAIRCCMVQVPEFGALRGEVLRDIATMVGATVISKEAGHTWKDAKIDMLGKAGSARITQWNTTIIDGVGGLAVQHRAEQIREQMNDANDYAKEVLKGRLARLVNGLMTIRVGGGSEIEIQEKKDRIDDSLSATRAAIEEGVLPGGGIALVRVMEAIDWSKVKGANKDQDMGINVIIDALPVPFGVIMENAGESPEVRLSGIKISPTNPVSWGFNAQTLEYEDFLVTGVIDPAKVVRLAMENAASVSGMLLTTKSVVSNKVA